MSRGKSWDEIAHVDTIDISGIHVEISAKSSVEEIAVAINEVCKSRKVHSYYIGVLLLVAKDRLRHGDLMTWINSNFDFSYSKANMYMNIATAFKVDDVGRLSVRSMYKLIKSSTPKSAVEVVRSRIRNGEYLSENEVNNILDCCVGGGASERGEVGGGREGDEAWASDVDGMVRRVRESVAEVIKDVELLSGEYVLGERHRDELRGVFEEIQRVMGLFNSSNGWSF